MFIISANFVCMWRVHIFFLLLTCGVCIAQQKSPSVEKKILNTATFGGGCFWCTEAIFDHIKGVDSIIVGYVGGDIPNPTYKKVAMGKTGYVEVVRLYYRPNLIYYQDLVEIFFGTHDPTTVNRQGFDVGTQYRSVIFYENEEQKKSAIEMKKKMARYYSKPIVTSIEPFKRFYQAEEEHQNFYKKNKQYPYSRVVIKPKVNHLLQNYYPYINWR